MRLRSMLFFSFSLHSIHNVSPVKRLSGFEVGHNRVVVLHIVYFFILIVSSQALLDGKAETKPVAAIIRRVQQHEQEKLTVVSDRGLKYSH